MKDDDFDLSPKGVIAFGLLDGGSPADRTEKIMESLYVRCLKFNRGKSNGSPCMVYLNGRWEWGWADNQGE